MVEGSISGETTSAAAPWAKSRRRLFFAVRVFGSWRSPPLRTLAGGGPTHRLTAPCLASLLFAVALISANEPFLLAAVLPVSPTVLAPVHPRRLGNGGRCRPVGEDGDDSEQEVLAREHCLVFPPKFVGIQ